MFSINARHESQSALRASARPGLPVAAVASVAVSVVLVLVVLPSQPAAA